MDARDSARLLACARLLIGAGLFLAPRRSGRAWTGDGETPVTAELGVRGMGARDVAIGLGTLVALEDDAHTAAWLQAGALCDAADALGTLAAWRDLPSLRRLLLLASEAGAAWLGLQLAAELDS